MIAALAVLVVIHLTSSHVCHELGNSFQVRLHMQGFISHEEFQSIPELSINPLHTRMGQVFNHVNFKASITSEFANITQPAR